MDHILTEKRDGIQRIEFNRPDKKNAITQAMYKAMADALTEAERDAAVRVVLFHGQPDAYTSGNDLQDFLADPPKKKTAPGFRFLRAISSFPKPLVAAVSGMAVGIGTTMLLHCDLVYAAPGTRFSLPFVNLALCPEAASSFLLPRLVGYQRAAELLFFGEPITAETAREIGLVNAIVPAKELLDAALAAAAKLAQKPAASLRATKALMRESYASGTAYALASEARVFVERLTSPEAKEAFSAFLEKRKPDFGQFQ